MVWLTKVCSQTLHMLAWPSQNWSMRNLQVTGGLSVRYRVIYHSEKALLEL